MIALAFVLTLFVISLIGAMGALFAPPTRRQRVRGAAFGAVGACFGCAFVVGRLWQEQSIALALPIGIRRGLSRRSRDHHPANARFSIIPATRETARAFPATAY